MRKKVIARIEALAKEWTKWVPRMRGNIRSGCFRI